MKGLKEQMVKRYVVKNCPAYTQKGDYYDCWENQLSWCQNCTDCLIKQVVDKCREEISIEENWCHRRNLAKEILQLFTIEEVE